MSQMLNNMSSWKLVTGFLNAENAAVLGSPTASPSGSIISGYGGMLGTKGSLTTTEALRLSDVTNVGTLYDGTYQCVRVYISASGNVTRGTVVFWQDIDNYVVTPDVTAATTGQKAGIAIGTITNGNYGFIQVGGKGAIKYKASITKASPLAGDLVVVDQAPTNTGDILADATTITSLTLKAVIGTALEVPVGGAVKLVLLNSTALLGV